MLVTVQGGTKSGNLRGMDEKHQRLIPGIGTSQRRIRYGQINRRYPSGNRVTDGNVRFGAFTCTRKRAVSRYRHSYRCSRGSCMASECANNGDNNYHCWISGFNQQWWESVFHHCSIGGKQQGMHQTQSTNFSDQVIV